MSGCTLNFRKFASIDKLRFGRLTYGFGPSAPITLKFDYNMMKKITCASLFTFSILALGVMGSALLASAAEPARTGAPGSTVMKTFPDFIPVYDGAKELITTIKTFALNTVGGEVTFSTSDPPKTVADFYEKVLTGAGYTILQRFDLPVDNVPASTLIAQHTHPDISFSLGARTHNGQTDVTIGFSRMGGP